MPDTVQTVTGTNLSETFTGPTPEAAIAAAAARYGANAAISTPVPVLTGGVGGFFARRSFKVLVQAGASADESGPDSVEDVADLFSENTPTRAAAPLVYGRPAITAPPAIAAPAVAPAAPQGTFAAALAGMAHSSTVESAVTRVTGQPVAVATVPLVDPMSYGGDIRPFGTFPGQPAGPDLPDVPFDLVVDGGVPASLAVALDGVDEALLDAAFAADLATRGHTAALAALFAEHYRSPGLPVLDPGEVLVVVGVGALALAAAQEIAGQVGATPGTVYAAGGPGCAGAVAASRRLRTPADVTSMRSRRHKAPIVVAVDTGWDGPDVNTGSILAALCAAVTWAAVDATRRDADTARWLAPHRRVDGLVVTNAEHTSAAAGVLRHDLPVLFLDGRPASPKRWAAILTSGASL